MATEIGIADKTTLDIINSNVSTMNTNISTLITNTNATITSRAPANTALSTAVWTNARAAKLDNIINYTGLSTQPIGYYNTSALNSNVTMLSVSGRGKLSYLECITNSNIQYSWIYIYVDGVDVYSITGIPVAEINLQGGFYFRSSLVITVGGNKSSSITFRWRYAVG